MSNKLLILLYYAYEGKGDSDNLTLYAGTNKRPSGRLIGHLLYIQNNTLKYQNNIKKYVCGLVDSSPCGCVSHVLKYVVTTTTND